MRTADRFLAREWAWPLDLPDAEGFMEEVRTEALAAPVVVADNVARYVHDRNSPLTLEGYPSLAPPWPRFWIEYPSSGRQRRGVWVIDGPLVDEPDPADHLGVLAHEALVDALVQNDVDRAEVGWVVTLVLFVEQDRRVWGPAGMFSLALNRNGQVIGNRWSVAPVMEIRSTAETKAEHGRRLAADDGDDDLPIPTHAEMEAMDPAQLEETIGRLVARRERLDARVSALTDAAEITRGAAGLYQTLLDLGVGTATEDVAHEWLWRALAPAMQTVAFMHCRNMVLDEVTPPFEVQRARRRRGHRPLVRYHTLRLDLPRRQGAIGPGLGVGEAALHIVAGHFAHYGDCCPGEHDPNGLLFGRLSGVYWMPSHARGNAQRGKVVTDFQTRVLPSSATRL